MDILCTTGADAGLLPLRAGRRWPSRLHGIGGGFRYFEELPGSVRESLVSHAPEVLPSARDLVPLALEKLSCGQIQKPEEVLPLYVRDEISWKKLEEQGKPE